MFPHDRRHSVFTDPLAAGRQLAVHPRAAVDPPVLVVDGLDLHRQFLPPTPPGAGLALEPRVEPAAGHLQHTAHHRDGPYLAMLLDEGELHGCSLAKNAAAFFKISRSMSSRTFSLRSRRFSAASAPSPLGTMPASPEYFEIQPRTDAGSTPRLLAAWVML